MLAELSTAFKEWIVTFHEHDSLLENVVSQELTEDEKKAAWEDYENEKKGLNNSESCGICWGHRAILGPVIHAGYAGVIGPFWGQ